jgi:3D (Asp-Asp-Asp) domain-containing protein
VGHLTKEYRVSRVDGQETKSELISETVTAPVDRIVAIGTYVPPATQFSTGPDEEITCAGGTLRVWATWYTAASAGGSGTTRTGTGVYKGIIAVDPTVIPLGTQMYVPGYGFGIAADTGGAIKGNKIDLGYGENDVKDWRTGYADICIIS